MRTMTIDSISTVHASGITLTSAVYGNPLTITDTGTVSGAAIGIYSPTDWTVVNQGEVSATGQGIVLIEGGSLTNGSHGLVTGANSAVVAYGGATIENAGTLSGGIVFYDGGSITNAAGGYITGTSGITLAAGSDPASTIDNAGTILASGYGVQASSTDLHNTGLIAGNLTGAQVLSGGLIDNAGTIETVGTAGRYGAYIGTMGSLTNEIGGTIYGLRDGVIGKYSGGTYAGLNAVVNHGSIGGGTIGIDLQRGGTVTNDGTIGGASYAVRIEGAPGAVENSGTIGGSTVFGVYLSDGGSITNAVGSLIDSSGYGVEIKNATGTIVNAGTILSSNSGVGEIAGGTFTNEASGTIRALGGFGVVLLGTGSVVNHGSIYGGGYGEFIHQGGTATNDGTIIGHRKGIFLVNATLENAGTITGITDASVFFNGPGTNRLIVDAGAVFNGIVDAATIASNTLELTSGAATGTISSFGTQYVGFQNITIDSGAAWTITGTKAGLGAPTIHGFNAHDKLDITNLVFNAHDTVSFDSVSDVLSILAANGTTVLDTLHMAGDFTGHVFNLADDGHGGTFVEEDGAACYLRGTRIRTPGGDRPVEDLRIGELISIHGGEALPLKWIGRRAYRDWLAIGNADVQPILFKAGSLADRVPARDLYVSPEHAMFLDGMLVPARHLVNGTSIVTCEGTDDIEYFHLEFDRHAVIVAEGAAAESFVDDDSRMLFHNADEYRRLYPGEPRRRFPEFCAPRVESGHALETLCRRLAERSSRKAVGTGAWRGYVDRATRTVVEGWAQGAQPVRLAIVVNGAVVGETLANCRREDLTASGLGDCGFSFVLPRPLSSELDHRIEVRRVSDWSPLSGGERLLRPSRGPIPASWDLQEAPANAGVA